ncbi:GGDEF domain-containing protein [Deinococcus sedimenti]|uniref:GGDEF domain-containing protein n=1 Tax=Deinococcus sedimenti TaxID=1867090 RepID=A0ABQ2S9P4_9DEIO|nr:GGDEF domain-containing protein [Deinococcus sedimenti]GGS11702.1 GGDEF domain-containing protein [Deinococcus sedimenti]
MKLKAGGNALKEPVDHTPQRSAHPHPTSHVWQSAQRWRLTEAQRRTVYLWVCALAAATQFVAALVILMMDASTPLWWPVVGGGLCLAAWILLWSRRLPWQWVDSGLLLTASVLVTTQIATHKGPLPADMLFGCVFLLLAAFSILPLKLAFGYMAGLLTVVGAELIIHGGPYALFWNLVLAGLLTAHLCTFGRNISLERAEATILERLANTDALTGLENRRAMMSRVHLAWPDTLGAALLLVDLDRFKRINDQLGHDVGDQVLRDVADRLAQVVGAQGWVGRWGGEEFLILIPGGQDSRRVAAELVESVRAQALSGGVRVTVSVGGATNAEVGSREDWVRLADARLYAAKEGGRDRVEWMQPADLEWSGDQVG